MLGDGSICSSSQASAAGNPVYAPLSPPTGSPPAAAVTAGRSEFTFFVEDKQSFEKDAYKAVFEAPK